MSNPFVGTWTYRSFHNKPMPVQSFDELRLAQAELVLNEKGPNWLGGTLSFGNSSLDMIGVSTLIDGRWQLRMRAEGKVKTDTAGWVYDYIGEMAADWPTGDGQRPAIIGTVIRSVYHDTDRHADLSYSFVAVRREPDLSVVAALPIGVVEHFADREHRLHHTVWHSVRNNWENFSDVQRQRIEALGWKPPRPARQFLNGYVKRPHLLNGSGIDFLYFHREMLIQFRRLMGEARPPAKPMTWVEIPWPGSRDDEVPPAWTIPGNPVLERRFAALKTDAYYWSRMRWWDQQFKEPAYLATLTLGQLGALLEFTVHNDMHLRWAAAARDPKTNVLVPGGRKMGDLDKKWDNPKYDFLYDFYSSHVNPFFWRLHGWVDDRIDDWFEAHERMHPGQIHPRQTAGVDWFSSKMWVEVDEPWVWPKKADGPPHQHNNCCQEAGNHEHGGHKHGEEEHEHGDPTQASAPGGNHEHGGHDSDNDRQARIEIMEQVLRVIFPSS